MIMLKQLKEFNKHMVPFQVLNWHMASVQEHILEARVRMLVTCLRCPVHFRILLFLTKTRC